MTDAPADDRRRKELATNLDVVVSEGGSEEHEYAALMTAADSSAELVADLADGLRRRVVIVAEAAGPDDPIPLRDVVAVHVDPADDAAADDDLAWYATQEIDSLLAGVV